MSVANGAIVATVGSHQANTIAISLETKYLLAQIGLQLGPTSNVESRVQATMEMYPRGYFHFWLILGYVKSPLFGPQMSFGGPIS